MDNTLKTVTPEEAGIPSGAFERFLKAVTSADICLHGMVAVKNGAIVAEGYWKPYDRDRKHRIYSSSKSFVSIAIGFLADEKLISLNDRVADFFPEYRPDEGFHPYISQATVRHLLMMSSPHNGTTYTNEDTDWVKPFFTKTPTHKPGTVFAYDTSATHTLGALVQKLTGMSFLDYLRPRLLDPIGFGKDAYCIKDPSGIAWGGSGVFCTPRDFAKVALTCANGGVFKGKQLIPAWYIKEATSRQIDNFIQGTIPDTRQGYGYQFWLRCNNGFAFRGMGGQEALCYPDKDFVLVLTADNMYNENQGTAVALAFNEHLLPHLSSTPLPADEKANASLRSYLESRAIPMPEGAIASPIMEKASGIDYSFDDNIMHISRIRFDFTPTGGVMDYDKSGNRYALSFGLGSWATQIFAEDNRECITSAAWSDETTLNITCYQVDDHIATMRIAAAFSENSLTVRIKQAAENCFKDYEGIVSSKD